MIRVKLWQICRNILMLLVLAGVPTFVLWQGGFLDDMPERLPWWVMIGIGALLGGFLSAPASNIASLLWEILSIHMRRGIEENAPKGCSDEETAVFRQLEYRKFIRLQQKVSFFRITWIVSRRAFRPVLLGVGILFIPVVVAVFVADPKLENIPTILGVIVVTAIIVAGGFGIASGLGIKSFLHEE